MPTSHPLKNWEIKGNVSFPGFLSHSRKFGWAFSGLGFPSAIAVKHPPPSRGDARDTELIPGSGRSPEWENGNPLRYSCQDNPMDREARQAIFHGVTKSLT